MSKRMKVVVFASLIAAIAVGVAFMSLSRGEQAVSGVHSEQRFDAANVGVKGEQAASFVLAFFDQGSKGGMTQLDALQRDNLRSVASKTFAAYTSGNVQTVRDQLIAVRGEIPSSWDMSNDWSQAATELSWFYGSLEVRPRDVNVSVRKSSSAAELNAVDEAPPAYGARNRAVGTHKQGLSVLSEPGPVVRSEVILPVGYATPSGLSIEASLGVEFQWSAAKKTWVQVGMRFYDYPVGQPFPMIPY